MSGWGSSYANNFFEFDGSLFFNLRISYSDTTLFRLEAGSTSPIDLGTYAVTDSGTVLNGSLYFAAYDTSSSGQDGVLYRLDPGTNIPVQVLDVNTSGDDRVGGLVVFGDALYFSAYSSDGDRELFKLSSDGTSATEFDFYDDGLSVSAD